MSTVRALPALVRSKFKSAQETGDLTFYSTQVSILSCNEFPVRVALHCPFQLRFSPALANKPKSNKPSNSIPVDPFENPAEGLFVTNLSSTHYLVLNKFPVIPDHFILATKEFKEQTDLLEEDDIGAAYDCVASYRKEGEELFGFFNSGPHSGASQPHRHIQFLPVESMRSGVSEGVTWNILADSLKRDQDEMNLPFTYFAATLPDGATSSQLHKIYTTLYEKAFKSAQQFAGSPSTSFSLLETTRDNESRISYNMGLTDRVMVLCPRVSESLKVTNNSGEIVGTVALNGTVLGGTLLVKSEAEWQALRSDESKLMDILKAIGIPSAKADHNERL